MQSSRLWASVRFSQVLWTVLPRNLPSVGLQQLMASHKTSWDALPGLTHGVVTFHRLGSSIQLRMDGGTHRLAVLTSSAFVGIFFFTNVPGPGLEKAQGGGGGGLRGSIESPLLRAAGRRSLWAISSPSSSLAVSSWAVGSASSRVPSCLSAAYRPSGCSATGSLPSSGSLALQGDEPKKPSLTSLAKLIYIMCYSI